MLGWVITLFILMIISGVLGFAGLIIAFAFIAKFLFFIFAVVLAVVLFRRFARDRRVP